MTVNLRKILFYTSGILLFIIILNILFNFFRWPYCNVSPYEAVPFFAPVILHSTYNDSTIINLNSLLAKLEASTNQKVTVANHAFAETKNLLSKIAPGSSPDCLFIPQLIGLKQISGLYVFDLRNDTLDQFFWESGLEENKMKTFNFDGTTYYTINNGSDKEIAFYNFRNLLIASPFPMLVEESIAQLKNYKTSIIFEEGFKVITNESFDSDATSLHVRMKVVPAFMKAFITPEYHTTIEALPNFGNWFTIDCQSFSGDAFSSSWSVSKTDSLILRESSILKVVPDNIGLLFTEKVEIKAERSDSIYSQYVASWSADEYAFAVMKPGSSIDPLLILKTKNSEFAEHYLLEYGEDFGLLASHSFLTYSMHQLLGNSLLQPYLQRFPGISKNPFFVILDDYVIFGNTQQSIESVVNKYIVGHSIISDERYLEFNQSLADKTWSYIYFDEKGFTNLVDEMLISKGSTSLNSPMKNQIPAGIFFMDQGNSSSFKIIFREKDESDFDKTEIIWRTALNAKIDMVPKVIWNKFKKEHEVLVQDNSNVLYLLNDDGELIWKKQLDGPLLSEINPIEPSNEETYHLLFNTAEKIYLLDHQGKPVGNYPIHLQSKATNGLCLTNIYHDYNYQYFLVCDNGNAYGFTNDGNPLPGWNPLMQVGVTSTPLQHFQFQGQDYLILLNDEGILAGFNSLGQTTFDKMNLGTTFNSAPEIIEIGKKKVIALNDQSGAVKLVNSKGQAFDLNLKKGDRGQIKTTFANITGDQRKDYIVLTGNTISCFQHETEKVTPIFEIAMDDAPDTIFPVNFPGADYSLIGTLSREKEQINLYNASAKLHDGFPLAGSTPFTLCKLYNNQNPILIVGYENSVYAYRIGAID